MIPESVSGVLFSEDKQHILLTLRRDVPVWVLPGGGIESGETPEEALVREILEETGLCVKIERCVGLYTPLNRLARTTLLYICNLVEGVPHTSSETRSVQFFPMSKLPPLPPPYLEWIQDASVHRPMVYKRLTSVTYGRFFKELMHHPLLILRFLLSRLGLPWNS